jgi:hypothetical protein
MPGLNIIPKTTIILLFVAFLISSPGIRNYAAEKKISPNDFLYRTRHPAGRKRWALMDGKVFHRRRDKQTIQAELYLGILFNKDRTLAQLLINNSQGYMVGQDFAKGQDGTSVIPINKATKDKPVLGNFGLRPEDLTMSFLYWKMEKELPEESTKMISCRVFKLKSPDRKENATVWISKKYYFPLKVKWTRASEKEPFRSLEVSSFKTQGKYGVIKRLELYGPGWRTRINFTKIEIGTPANGTVREGLFRKLN